MSDPTPRPQLIQATINACPQKENCPSFQALLNYGCDQKDILHCQSVQHPTIHCRHGADCFAFARLCQGGFEQKDQAHAIIYMHPRLAQYTSDAKQPLLTHKNDSSSGEGTLAGMLYSNRKLCPCGNAHEDDYKGLTTEALVAEVEANGFGSVLILPKGKTSWFSLGKGKEKTLMDVAREKTSHPRNAEYQLNETDLLAILLYTGTDIQGGARLDMMRPTGQTEGIWPMFHLALHRAVRKGNSQREKSQGAVVIKVDYNAGIEVASPEYQAAPCLYHGLHNINLKDLNFTELHTEESEPGVSGDFTLSAPTSCSTSEDVALSFACGVGGTASSKGTAGVLLRIRLTTTDGVRPAALDVSWVSKFPSEREVLLSPFTTFTAFPERGFGSASDYMSGARFVSIKAAQDAVQSRVKKVHYEVGTGDNKRIVTLDVLDVASAGWYAG